MTFQTKFFVIVFLLFESNRLRAEKVDFVETAKSQSLTKLVAAIEAANLTKMLNTVNSLTMFAPTDESFGPLISDDLIQEKNKKILEKILRHHIVKTSLNFSSIKTENLTTFQNTTLFVNKTEDKIRIDEKANVISTADIEAKNGFLHKIDNILLPPLDLFETAVIKPNLKTLVAAIRHANLVDTLQVTGHLTVFAPKETFENLTKQLNKDELANILKYHVVPQRLIETTSLTGSLKTLTGDLVTFSGSGSSIKINDVTITFPSVPTTNGVIYLIDKILTPPTKSGVSRFFDRSSLIFLASTILLCFW